MQENITLQSRRTCSWDTTHWRLESNSVPTMARSHWMWLQRPNTWLSKQCHSTPQMQTFHMHTTILWSCWHCWPMKMWNVKIWTKREIQSVETLRQQFRPKICKQSTYTHSRLSRSWEVSRTYSTRSWDISTPVPTMIMPKTSPNNQSTANCGNKPSVTHVLVLVSTWDLSLSRNKTSKGLRWRLTVPTSGGSSIWT